MRKSKAKKSELAPSVSKLMDPSAIFTSPALRQPRSPNANSATNQTFVQTPPENSSDNQPFDWSKFLATQSPSTPLTANPFVGVSSPSTMDLPAEFQGCQLTPAAMARLQQLEKMEQQAQQQPSVASATPRLEPSAQVSLRTPAQETATVASTTSTPSQCTQVLASIFPRPTTQAVPLNMQAPGGLIHKLEMFFTQILQLSVDHIDCFRKINIFTPMKLVNAFGGISTASSAVLVSWMRGSQ